MVTKADRKPPTPESQLQSYIDRLDPKNRKLFRAVRAAVRKRLPTANELGYDYTSHVVIAYTATESAIHAVAALDGRVDGVRLYLMNGPQLPDPKKLLQGSGKQARFVPLDSSRRLAHPDVKALIAAAIELAKVPLPAKGKGKLMLRGPAAKQRPGPKR